MSTKGMTAVFSSDTNIMMETVRKELREQMAVIEQTLRALEGLTGPLCQVRAVPHGRKLSAAGRAAIAKAARKRWATYRAKKLLKEAARFPKRRKAVVAGKPRPRRDAGVGQVKAARKRTARTAKAS